MKAIIILEIIISFLVGINTMFFIEKDRKDYTIIALCITVICISIMYLNK